MIAFILADSGARTLAQSEQTAGLATAALEHDGHTVTHTLSSAADVEALIDGQLTADQPNGPLGTAVTGDRVCALMYTSGTTGRPKGAMLTQDNMFWNAVNLLTAGPGLSRNDVSLAAAPLFHIGALGLSALPVLYAGGTVVLQSAFDPERTAALIAEYEVTFQFLVPAMWGALLRVPHLAGSTRSLRWAVCGGAPCPLPVIEGARALGWNFTEGFGMTETAPAALALDGDDVVDRAGSVGLPFPHVEVRIVDEHDADVPVGTVGELAVRGPNVFAGYWNLPEATAEALRGGWFHTGDLAVSAADGFITLVDRKKDMVISGGENVYPVEVEQALHRHPGVADVAVIGLPDEKWGETVCAVVVPEAGCAPDPAELIDFTREKIAAFKSPRRIEFLDELPRNATGKVLKRVLRERYAGFGEAFSR